jgi:DNA-binding transcriptional LysR family regulator
MITVAFSGATLISLLPRMITPFRRRFPRVRIKVMEGTLPMLETPLRDGLIDLYYGPVPGHFSDPALTVTVLFENERIVVARRGHPLEEAQSLRDLVSAEWVTTPVAVNTDTEVNSLFEVSGLPAPHIAVQAESNMSVAAIVANSDLLAVVPQQWITLVKSSDMLIRIPISETIAGPRICAVRRANMPLAPVAQYLDDLAFRSARHQASVL